MAMAENIPINVFENKEPIIKGEVLKMEYLQWRLLFYFHKLIVYLCKLFIKGCRPFRTMHKIQFSLLASFSFRLHNHNSFMGETSQF